MNFNHESKINEPGATTEKHWENMKRIGIPIKKIEATDLVYFGLRDFECHLAKYPPGTFYKKHLDRFEQDSSRGFTFIFYLHSDWTEADGGELVLYHKDGRILETIIPRPGSFMCFLPGEFPHEVRISHKERWSLTGWIHTKNLY